MSDVNTGTRAECASESQSDIVPRFSASRGGGGNSWNGASFVRLVELNNLQLNIVRLTDSPVHTRRKLRRAIIPRLNFARDAAELYP